MVLGPDFILNVGRWLDSHAPQGPARPSSRGHYRSPAVCRCVTDATVVMVEGNMGADAR